MTQEKPQTAAAAPAKKHRLLKISILRYNPQDPDSVPHMQTYELEESDSMTLFIALNDLRNEQDPTLQFDFVCRAGICGSCAMLINGKPGLPHADEGPARGVHARSAAGLRAHRRPVGQHRQVDAQHVRAHGDVGSRQDRRG